MLWLPTRNVAGWRSVAGAGRPPIPVWSGLVNNARDVFLEISTVLRDHPWFSLLLHMLFKSATLGVRIRSSNRENKYALSRVYSNVVRSQGRLLHSVITTMWACGAKNDTLEPSDREWICPICGTLNQCDPNAVCIIEVETLRILDQTPGLAA